MVLALARLGAIHVPLDPALPENRLRSILEDSAPLFILSDQPEAYAGFSPPCIRIDGASGEICPAEIPDDPTETLALLDTSGSTGRPKGVMMVHGGVVNEAHGIANLAGIGAGYWQQPDLTAAAFHFSDGRGWYRTGDRVYHERRGKLRFLGRQDEQLKIRGNRVEPNEVVRVLESMPGVSAAHVGLVRGHGAFHQLAAWIRWNATPDDAWPGQLAGGAALVRRDREGMADPDSDGHPDPLAHAAVVG